MAKTNTVQATFNSGQLSDRMNDREDVRAYYAGAREMTNVIPVRQGGFDQREGLEFVSRVQRQLTRVATGGITPTAPNGGTAANANDDDDSTLVTTTTGIGTTSPYVVVHFDLGSAQDIVAVDVTDMLIAPSTAIEDDEFQVQYSTDNSTWFTYDTGFTVKTSDDGARSRRRGGARTARYWRIAREAGSPADHGTGTASLAGVRFWTESASLSEHRMLNFKFADGDSFIAVCTDCSLQFFKAGVLVGHAYIPHLSSELAVLRWVQSLDTMILFHRDHAPWRVFRQETDDEWDFRAQPFTNIPEVDFGDSPGGTNEVQTVQFSGTWAASDTFKLSLDGEEMAGVAFGSGGASLATALQTAMRNLPNTSSDGITVTGTNPYTVTFGGDDGSQDWPDFEIVSSTGSEINIATTTDGAAPAEPIMSASRGWPGCGVFYQGRLYLGGFQSKVDTVVASKAGQFFNLDSRTTRSDSGFVAATDTDALAQIFDLVASDHVLALTSEGPFFNDLEPVTPSNFALKKSGSEGVKWAARPVQVDDAVLFVHESGNQIFESIFEEVRDRFQQTDLAVLTDAINSPVDAAVQAASSTERTSLVYFVNADGSIAVLSTLRAQEITAFTRLEAAGDGVFKAVAVDDLAPTYVTVRRTIDGSQVDYLERFTSGGYLDCAHHHTSFPVSTVNNLDWLEGETVALFLDGSPAGTATVSSGSVTLPREAAESLEIGLDWVPRVETMPYRRQFSDGSTLQGRKARIPRIAVDVIDTGVLSVGANGAAPHRLELRRMGAASFGASMLDSLKTGPVRQGGFKGWSYEATVVITRAEPGPLKVRGISYEVVF